MNTFPDIERVDLEVALKFWTEELSKQVGIPSSVHIFKDTKSMQLSFEQGRINFIVTSPLELIEYFDIQQLTEGYKAYSNDSSTEDILVITHIDSHINNAQGFKNKRLSILLNDKACEMFVNTLTLEHSKHLADKIFKKIDYLYKSPQLIYRLFFKKTDVILVYQRAYQLAIELNPQIKQKTKIIYKLPNIHRGIGFFHQRIDPNFRQKVLNKLEGIHTTFKGQQLLNIFFAEQLKRSSPADLKNTLQLKQKYENLIKLNSAQK